MLDFHILLLLLCEWDTLIPKCAAFSQIAHFAMPATSLKDDFNPTGLQQNNHIRYCYEMQGEILNLMDIF